MRPRYAAFRIRAEQKRTMWQRIPAQVPIRRTGQNGKYNSSARFLTILLFEIKQTVTRRTSSPCPSVDIAENLPAFNQKATPKGGSIDLKDSSSNEFLFSWLRINRPLVTNICNPAKACRTQGKCRRFTRHACKGTSRRWPGLGLGQRRISSWRA